MSIKFFPDSNICFEKPSGKTLCIPCKPRFPDIFPGFHMIFAAFSPMESKLHGVSCRLDLSSFASVQAFATDLGILGRPVELLVCALPKVWSHLLVRPTETYVRLKLVTKFSFQRS